MLYTRFVYNVQSVEDMKFVQLLILVALLVATVSAAFSVEKLRDKFNQGAENATFFVKSLRYLHRGPPVQEPQIQTRATIETEWIEQKLDHFDESVTESWKMRYMVNREYFQAGAPMFIYLGGEWAIGPGAITSGHFVDIAKEHNGILFYTEHRYYGESRPTSDITVPNLKYLHVKQALADLAHFIQYQRANNPELSNSKVIMSGGSYSGSMVVWFKRLYPDLLTGGWASSAPLFAEMDFREYKEIVGRAIRELGSQRCYDRIKNGIAELEDMFANKRGAEVKSMVKICNNFDENNDLDLWSFFASLSNVFSGVVQYQSDDDVPQLCDYLMQFESDVIAIAGLLEGMSSDCLDFSYMDSLDFYMDSTYAHGASRPWYYQTCNEYGWYQTSTSSKQPFGSNFPLLLYTTMCHDVYGDEYTNSNIYKKVAQTNADFGGWDPNVENVYYTHGELDPWSFMGLTASQGATILPLASHCADRDSISDDDTLAMRESKLRVAALVREWLAEDGGEDE